MGHPLHYFSPSYPPVGPDPLMAKKHRPGANWGLTYEYRQLNYLRQLQAGNKSKQECPVSCQDAIYHVQVYASVRVCVCKGCQHICPRGVWIIANANNGRRLSLSHRPCVLCASSLLLLLHIPHLINNSNVPGTCRSCLESCLWLCLCFWLRDNLDK